MKKLINILFVRRPEIENKWWNRLFNVFLVLTGIFVFILALGQVITSYHNSWFSYYNPTALSLESNNLTTNLSFSDLKENIAALQKNNVSSSNIQSYINNYVSDGNGGYVLKNQTAIPNTTSTQNTQRSNSFINDLGNILIDIAMWIIIPIFAVLLWIIFLSSIVYRTILYIIFGKKK